MVADPSPPESLPVPPTPLVVVPPAVPPAPLVALVTLALPVALEPFETVAVVVAVAADALVAVTAPVVVAPTLLLAVIALVAALVLTLLVALAEEVFDVTMPAGSVSWLWVTLEQAESTNTDRPLENARFDRHILVRFLEKLQEKLRLAPWRPRIERYAANVPRKSHSAWPKAT